MNRAATSATSATITVPRERGDEPAMTRTVRVR